MIKILSLGAGVQSTCVLRLAIHGEIERPDHVIFADTGWEPKKVYQNLELLKKEAKGANIPLHVVDSGFSVKDMPARLPLFLVNRDGTRGQLTRSCTDRLKIRPVEELIKKLIGLKKHERQRGRGPLCEHWFGISMDEKHRMRMSEKWWSIYYYPLIDLGMSRLDCEVWMDSKGYPPVPKSACVICPYRANSMWRWLKENEPEAFEEACKYDESVIRATPGVDGEPFLHVERVALREADIKSLEDHGQLRLWADECSGLCGV